MIYMDDETDQKLQNLKDQRSKFLKHDPKISEKIRKLRLSKEGIEIDQECTISNKAYNNLASWFHSKNGW
jgi:hypothetical protein